MAMITNPVTILAQAPYEYSESVTSLLGIPVRIRLQSEAFTIITIEKNITDCEFIIAPLSCLNPNTLTLGVL